jgi:hypothetical protein
LKSLNKCDKIKTDIRQFTISQNIHQLNVAVEISTGRKHKFAAYKHNADIGRAESEGESARERGIEQ